MDTIYRGKFSAVLMFFLIVKISSTQQLLIATPLPRSFVQLSTDIQSVLYHGDLNQ